MSRAALRLGLAVLLCAGMAWAGLDPHLDPGLTPGACRACHAGHGVSRSPMLPSAQVALCLSCHGNQTSADEMVGRGLLSPSADPLFMEAVLAKAHQHPMSRQSFSRYEQDAAVCTSCHTPHRSMPENRSDSEPTGRPYLSPGGGSELEYQLCERCHGSDGSTTQALTDISRLLSPENRSYHPVEGPSTETSPSVLERLSGRQVNCTDCHGNDRPSGPRGPHGSSVPYLLRRNYLTTDGSDESGVVYGLCYQCHRREAVLERSPFPEHSDHIVEVRASCATCHNAHGSVANRALIRFGEETQLGGVSPSISTGTLAFVSDGPGSGACYLTCHGRDHGPEAYGAMELRLRLQGRIDPGARRRPQLPSDSPVRR